MSRYTFVIREIGGEDQEAWAVVQHGEAYEGKWKRKVLFVLGWYTTEDAARADAHRANHPDYGA